MPPRDPPIRMQVHGGSDRPVDGILRLIEEAATPRPLRDLLQAMCAEVARIASADVVSIYVVEREDDSATLVMQANVGFPESAVGNVRLRMGEGITGFAAECMRPVTAEVGERDVHFKHIPELDEERFPAFLAVPLLSGGATIGVLVLQRREASGFTDAEVALATAFATTFTHALERARAQRAARDEDAPSASRSARLSGTGLALGVGVGRAVMLPTFEALIAHEGDSAGSAQHAEAAFVGLVRLLSRSYRRLESSLDEASKNDLAALVLILDDQRLRKSIRSETQKLGPARGLRKVAREYAAVPFKMTADAQADDWLVARAREVEELCLLTAAGIAGEPVLRPGMAVVVAERLNVFTALLAAVQRIACIALGAKMSEDALAVRVARAACLPVVSEVEGLFAWLRPDDTLLVDGGQGFVRVNPSAAVLAKHRYRG